jgi:hypothetical protein
MISPSVGTPLLQQISFIDNGVLDEIEEIPLEVSLDRGFHGTKA